MKQLLGRGCKRDGVAVIGVEHAGTRCGGTELGVHHVEDARKEKHRRGRRHRGAVFAEASIGDVIVIQTVNFVALRLR